MERAMLGLLIVYRTDRLISKVSISVSHCVLTFPSNRQLHLRGSTNQKQDSYTAAVELQWLGVKDQGPHNDFAINYTADIRIITWALWGPVYSVMK